MRYRSKSYCQFASTRRTIRTFLCPSNTDIEPHVYSSIPELCDARHVLCFNAFIARSLFSLRKSPFDRCSIYSNILSGLDAVGGTRSTGTCHSRQGIKVCCQFRFHLLSGAIHDFLALRNVVGGWNNSIRLVPVTDFVS